MTWSTERRSEEINIMPHYSLQLTLALLFLMQKINSWKRLLRCHREGMASAKTEWLARQFVVIMSNHTEKWEYEWLFSFHAWVCPWEECVLIRDQDLYLREPRVVRTGRTKSRSRSSLMMVVPFLLPNLDTDQSCRGMNFSIKYNAI